MRRVPSGIWLYMAVVMTGCTIVAGVDENYVFNPPVQTSSSTGGASDAGGVCSPNESKECYAGPYNTMDIGICKAGTQTCLPDGAAFGECIGAQTPVTEDCTTASDDENCDGDPSCNGLPLWSMAFGDNGDQYGARVAVSWDGKPTFGGYFGGSVDFGGDKLVSAGTADIFLASFGTDGKHAWSRSFGDAAEQYLTCLDIDTNGNVYIGGYFESAIDFGGGPLTSEGEADAFVAKFDSNGGHLWSHRLGGSGYQAVRSLKAGASGDLWLAGNFQNTMKLAGKTIPSKGLNDVFIVKLDAQGEILWHRSFGASGNDFAASVATDAAGNVVLLGSFGDSVDFGDGKPVASSSGLDIFLVKLSLSGSYIWHVTFGSALDDEAAQVAIGQDGSAFVIGDFASPITTGNLPPLVPNDSTDIYVGKIDTTGAWLWSQGFGGANAQHVRGIAVDKLGNATLAGDFVGELDFGDQKLASALGSDIFIAKLDPKGNPIWSTRAGDANAQECHGISVDTRGYVFVTGHFSGVLDFPGSPIDSIASQGLASDIFAIKFAP